jgi:hypothetical protein
MLRFLRTSTGKRIFQRGDAITRCVFARLRFGQLAP